MGEEEPVQQAEEATAVLAIEEPAEPPGVEEPAPEILGEADALAADAPVESHADEPAPKEEPEVSPSEVVVPPPAPAPPAEETGAHDKYARQPPGGRTAINLSIDIHAQPITRPPSGRAPPGGHSTLVFGNEGPRLPTPKDQQFQSSFRTLDGAKVEAIRELDHTPARSVAHTVYSAAAISGADVVHVPRVQPPTPSKLVFTEDGALFPDAPPEKKIFMSAQKKRELSGNATNIFSGEELVHPTTEDAPSPGPNSPDMVPADKKHIESMMLSELRTALRARGLSPAGAKQVLVERLIEGIQHGAAPVLIPAKGKASGMTSAAISNNYARSEGQNIGNFITDRPSSRVSRPPGGASQIIFGDEAPPQAPTFLRTVTISDGKRAQLASNLFSEGPADPLPSPSRAVNATKIGHLRGQDIFKDDLAPAPTVSNAKKGEIQGQMQGSGLASGGAMEQPYLTSVSLSEGKKLELSGHNSVFKPGGEVAQAVHVSEAKRKELSGEANESFFTGGSQAKVHEPVTLSQGKQRELSGTREAKDSEVTWRPMSARIESGRARQFGSMDNFKPAEIAKKELTAAATIKMQQLGGQVVFNDNAGRPSRPSTRVTQSPGGTSQIVFG